MTGTSFLTTVAVTIVAVEAWVDDTRESGSGLFSSMRQMLKLGGWTWVV